MALIPVLHRLIVKPFDVSEADEAIKRAKAVGIHIELDKREQAAVEIGVVMSIGETAYKDFKAEIIPIVGDKVIYAKYSGKQIKDKDESLLILNDEDVVAIIKE